MNKWKFHEWMEIFILPAKLWHWVLHFWPNVFELDWRIHLTVWKRREHQFQRNDMPPWTSTQKEDGWEIAKMFAPENKEDYNTRCGLFTANFDWLGKVKVALCRHPIIFYHFGCICPAVIIYVICTTSVLQCCCQRIAHLDSTTSHIFGLLIR